MTTDIVGSDIPKGKEVKWYAGGVATTEEITVSAAQVSGGITLAAGAVAEYGSVVGTVDGTVTAFRECKTDNTTNATEADGTTIVTYSGITEGDVVVLKYVATGVTAMTQVITCEDVSCGSSADTISKEVQGQANKITSVSAADNTATLDEAYYNQTLVGLCLGDAISGSPTTGKGKWTNAFRGFKKVGALVGKRYDEAGNVDYKWFLVGAQATGIDGKFPAKDFYTRSLKFLLDYWSEADLA